MKRSRVISAVGTTTALLLSVSAAGTAWAGPTAPPPVPTRQVTTWAASDDMAGGTISDRTIRNIVHTSIGGSGLRVRLSNAKGTRTLRLDSVYLGVQDDGAALVPGSNQRVEFGGSTTATIPPGETVLSDPLSGTVPAQQNLAISIHVSGDSGPLTAHNRSMQHSFKSTSGDHAADEEGTEFLTETAAWVWLDALVVDAHKQTGTVAVLGDSITAGVGTTINANRRWPDILADRLATLPPVRQMGVANEGISGNRVLGGVSRPGGAGDAALVRLTNDVLTKPGVDTVFLFEGVNDIGAGASAEEIIEGYRQLISQSHDAGVCIVAATVTPFGGSVFVDPEGETVRQAVNDFIRNGDEFDAVMDFDAATRDPDQPERLRPAFHDGDGLHPNDAGNAAMAAAIDLNGLRCK